jgi:hypothetical protein
MNNLHPVFRMPLAAMSGDAVRSAREAANQPAPLRPYIVAIKLGGVVLRHFEAFAPDACTCVMQHQGMLSEGEKLEVRPLLEDKFKQAEADRCQAVELSRTPNGGFLNV